MISRLMTLGLVGLFACASAPPRDDIALRREADAHLQAARDPEAIRAYLAYVDALDRLPPALGVDRTASTELREQAFGRIAFVVVATQLGKDTSALRELPTKQRAVVLARIVASLDDEAIVPQAHRALPEVYLAVSAELESQEAFEPALAVLARMTARFPANMHAAAIAERSASLRNAIRIRTRAEVP
jgi:hypothetical protein